MDKIMHNRIFSVQLFPVTVPFYTIDYFINRSITFVESLGRAVVLIKNLNFYQNFKRSLGVANQIL